MKKFLIIIALLMTIAPITYAQDEEPEPTAVVEEESDSLDETIKSLKEKIEDKVEQINQSSKRIIKGLINSVDDETIEIQTDSDNTFTVSLDDTISSYFTASVDDQEELEQEDLEEGDYIIVSGPIIEDQVSANIIYKQVQYSVLQGQITALNESAFTVDVVTPEKDEYTIDIEDDTEQSMLNSKTREIEDAGFSKYKVGDSLHFVIITPDDSDDSATAIRTLIIPQEFFVAEKPADEETDDEESSTETEE